MGPINFNDPTFKDYWNAAFMSKDKLRKTVFDDRIVEGVEGGISAIDAANADNSEYARMKQDLEDRENAANQAKARIGREAGDRGAHMRETLGRYGLIDDNPLTMAAVEGFGDFLGGISRTGILQTKANEAANIAGAVENARNGQERLAIMDAAGERADSMNLANAQAGRDITDSSAANAIDFERAMGAAAFSGIEGGNSERNLKYGMDRADAQNQLQLDLMGRDAANLQKGMVNSFEQLSRNKVNSMQGAFNDVLSSFNNNLTELRHASAIESNKTATTWKDYENLMMEGMRRTGNKKSKETQEMYQ
jgi:hypothetical protein